MNLTFVPSPIESSTYFSLETSLSAIGSQKQRHYLNQSTFLILNSLSWSLNADDISRLFLLFSCKLSTYDLVGSSIFVLGDVKVELGLIDFCSSTSNFSSGSNLNNDNSSTQWVVDWSWYSFDVKWESI